MAQARARFGDRVDAQDSEGARIRAGLAMAEAAALGAAELDDLHVDPDEIEGRMLNAMASALVMLLCTLGEGDNELAFQRLPRAMNILFMEAARQIGNEHIEVPTARMGNA